MCNYKYFAILSYPDESLMQSVQYSAVFGDGALGLVLKNVEGYAVVHSLFCEISGEQGQAAEAGVTVGSQLIQVEGIP